MRNALWLDSLTITEEPRRSYDGKMRWGCVPPLLAPDPQGRRDGQLRGER